jgi:hypothetical protein
MPAMVAYRQLGIFVQDAKKREAWIDAEDVLARNSATFYAAMLEAPGIKEEDLVDGFKEYNVELLAWFQM